MSITSNSRFLLALATLCVTGAQAAYAAGDPVQGAKVFDDECAECHNIQGKNKKGPTLLGVYGRKAGNVPAFEYSDAMRNSGVTWTADKLDNYLTMPRKFVPGAVMKYDGLMDAKARTDLIAFLQTVK